MRRKIKNTSILLLAVLGCFSTFNGCASEGTSPLKENISMEDTQVNSDIEKETLESNETNISEWGSLGTFSMQDIEGNTYTQDMFSDYDLTMVNVFTTWCSPCVSEIPDLEMLKNEMSSQGINVVGIVLDSIDIDGNSNQETIEKAKLLAEKTGATYPFLIPDAGYLNGRLMGIAAVPETFFVDKEGNIVGDTYSGSRTFEDWKSIVETVKEGVAE